VKYDPASWLKHCKESVFRTARPGTLIELPREYLSAQLLVRWTRGNFPTTVIGSLEAVIISPLGNPTRPRQDFEIVTDRLHYQLWTVNNDGLPYKLHAKHLGNPKLSSQIEIWEYIPLITNPAQPDNQLQVSSSQGVTIVSFTPPPAAQQISREGTPISVTAVAGVMSLLPVSPGDLRLNGYGVNNTNKVLWVLFSNNPISAAKPAIAIAIGGNFEIADGYQGVVQGFIAPGGAAVTGTINMTEFNAV
jgi:hypothetical protein